MEPWYQCEEITASEVKTVIHQGMFHKELHATHNSPQSSKFLRQLLYNDKRKLNPPYKMVTFEAIHKTPNWQVHAENILSKEISKMKSFGSYRGFYTFLREELTKSYAKGVVQECWAKPVLAKFARIWLQNHYAFKGNGFVKAKKNYNTISSNYFTK